MKEKMHQIISLGSKKVLRVKDINIMIINRKLEKFMVEFFCYTFKL